MRNHAGERLFQAAMAARLTWHEYLPALQEANRINAEWWTRRKLIEEHRARVRAARSLKKGCFGIEIRRSNSTALVCYKEK